MLSIHERFFSIQGEGVHMGRSAFFIRTLGCPVKCPWCDSAGTWHPGFKPAGKNLMDEYDLAEEAKHANPAFVVVTGGEPTIFDLRPLTKALHSQKLRVHLETCGAFPIRGDFDWITLSPKDAAKPLTTNLNLASEFKLIIERPGDIDRWCRVLADAGVMGPQRPPVWLHPEWGHREDADVLRAIVREVQHSVSCRAGWQIHKLYKADAGDLRSRLPVPLGGDPKRGY